MFGAASTSPRSGSHSRLIIARRNLWSIIHGSLVASQTKLSLQKEAPRSTLIGGHQ
jgi:hypothetical protein